MTNAASTLGLGPAAGLAPLRAKWGWIVALGVVYVVAGVIALGSVVMATIASSVGGRYHDDASRAFSKSSTRSRSKPGDASCSGSLLGVLYVIAGFIAFRRSALSFAIWLTLLLGAALVASGIVRIFLGFNMRGWDALGLGCRFGRGHGSCSGVIILDPMAGILGLYALGIILGVDLVFAGASWIGLGFGLHNAPAA